MAHKYFPGGYRIEVPLSVTGISAAITESEEFWRGFLAKVEEFTRAMAVYGAVVAQTKVMELDAIDTGALQQSIMVRKGEDKRNGFQYVIYTDSPYAVYVEFGTGPAATSEGHIRKRDGKYFPPRIHPSGDGVYRDTPWVWNGRSFNGMPARPFLWETLTELQKDETVRRVAMEVFGR